MVSSRLLIGRQESTELEKYELNLVFERTSLLVDELVNLQTSHIVIIFSEFNFYLELLLLWEEMLKSLILIPPLRLVHSSLHLPLRLNFDFFLRFLFPIPTGLISIEQTINSLSLSLSLSLPSFP